MRKYEIYRLNNVVIPGYTPETDETEQHGFATVEAPNLFRAVVAMRKWEAADADEAFDRGENYDYPDWLEVWEVGDDGIYTNVRRYVFPMRDM